MQRILIRHVKGTRTNQVDEFRAEGFIEIQAGRDEGSTVRYDADREDLVSRNHLRIYAEPAGSNNFYLADLQSRNGTFLNRQRISAPSRIHHGDAVQLGSGGPEFRFELDPAPAATAKPTRMLGSNEAGAFGSGLARATRVATDGNSPRPVGRATVERMLDDTFGKVKRESGKTFWAGIAALIMISVLGVGAYFYLRHTAAQSAAGMLDQQQMLAQMSQVVKRQPEDDAAVRSQIDALSAAMKKMIAENETLRQKAEANGSEKAEQDTVAPPASYEAGLSQAAQFYNSNDFVNAYNQYVQTVQVDPSRWEGYYYAGLTAEKLDRPDDALTAYQGALADAQDDASKALITARISALQGSASQAN